MFNTSMILTKDSLKQLIDYRCMFCGRLMFRANKNILVLWLADGYPAKEIPLNMGWVQYKCRGCEHGYNIYWQ